MSFYQIPLSYRFARLKALAEANIDFNHFNPHLTVADYIRTNKIDTYYFCHFSSEECIQRMLSNPELVNVDALMYNTHSKIGILLEQHKSKLNHLNWTLMSCSQNVSILKFIRRYPEHIQWKYLSGNKSPEAIHILKEHLDKIDWNSLSKNPSAIEILENNQDKIHWMTICENPNAIHLIEQNLERISWSSLCANPNAIHIIERNLNRVNWAALSKNPNAIHILEQNLNDLNPVSFSSNPNAIKIMSKYPEMFSFESFLSQPDAISYIETHAERINRENLHILAENPNGIPLIQKLLDTNRITEADLTLYTLRALRSNSSLYELDYKTMGRFRVDIIYYNLIAKALHPDVVDRWLDDFLKRGGDIEDFYN